ncbi:acyl carrier protein [Colwellia echini]|uniref:Acyl carrier protein n=1 Tax=Colwellia echini TaxID=1982103 RepID=A0ABY3MWK4_9GAMM|nr:acyl carrier protein [Colwellia echini]TYK65598.1 acyl carrier protein [Colwellia echini]
MLIEEKLQSFFKAFLMERGIETTESNLLEFNFVESGLLDSFEILTMIMAIETEYSLTISPDELLDGNNATVGGLLKTLVSK